MGFFEIAKKNPSVEIVNISKLPSRIIELTANGKPYPIALPKLLLDEVDFSITCPLPKIHCMTKITLSFKNQWGCLPTMRHEYHLVLDDALADLNSVIRPALPAACQNEQELFRE